MNATAAVSRCNQTFRNGFTDCADLCQFRGVAFAFAGVSRQQLELTRGHWLETVSHQVQRPRWSRHGDAGRFGPTAPRVTLFHVA